MPESRGPWICSQRSISNRSPASGNSPPTSSDFFCKSPRSNRSAREFELPEVTKVSVQVLTNLGPAFAAELRVAFDRGVALGADGLGLQRLAALGAEFL